MPVIGSVLDELARAPGTLVARLSGAGPTAFGIYAFGIRGAHGGARDRRATAGLVGTAGLARLTRRGQ